MRNSSQTEARVRTISKFSSTRIKIAADLNSSRGPGQTFNYLRVQERFYQKGNLGRFNSSSAHEVHRKHTRDVENVRESSRAYGSRRERVRVAKDVRESPKAC